MPNPGGTPWIKFFSTIPSSRILGMTYLYIHKHVYLCLHIQDSYMHTHMHVVLCTEPVCTKCVCVHITSISLPPLLRSSSTISMWAFSKISWGRSKACWFSLMPCNFQTCAESTEQVKNPWHSEGFLPGFENIKPPPSICTNPWTGENSRSGLHCLEKTKQLPLVQKSRKAL